MRLALSCFVLACSGSCARGLPAASDTTAAERAASQPGSEESAPVPPRSEVVVTGRSARELIDEAGLATFLEDRALEEAAIDADAMERWFTRPPSRVYFYSERAAEVGPDVTVVGHCQQVHRWDSGVLNSLSIVVWQDGGFRTVLDLGQDTISLAEQTRARGAWETDGVRRLPLQAIAWDDEHIRYAEGAEHHELACVPTLRTVPCGGDPLGGRGHCVDHELVARPWRAPTVPHVGPVIAGYHDRVPEVPEGDCAVRCEPSSCDEALRTATLSSAALYAEDAPVLAAFRSAGACRAFATARTESRSGPFDEHTW